MITLSDAERREAVRAGREDAMGQAVGVVQIEAGRRIREIIAQLLAMLACGDRVNPEIDARWAAFETAAAIARELNPEMGFDRFLEEVMEEVVTKG